jgi:excisionase family DNA binding protein
MKDALQPATAGIEQPAGDRDVVGESPYLTSAEAARYLRYASVGALYKAIPGVGIPACRRGGKTFLFDRRELDRWLRGHGRKRRAK